MATSVADTPDREETTDDKAEVDGNVPEDSNTDDVDGFLKPKKGRYCPREEEIKTWGPSVGQFAGQKDPDEYIFRLLKTTAPETRWRRGFRELLQMYDKEDACRVALDFLLSNGEEGIKATEKGFDELVCIGEMVPKPLNCGDWMTVMEGLHFDLTSPCTVRDIQHVDVVVGKKTDIDALKGFCYLVEFMRGLSWSAIQSLLNLGEADGETLYEAVEQLGTGSGIKDSARSPLETLYSKHKVLMKDLGFRKGGSKHALQWQNPNNMEFSRTFAVVSGLYRSADKLETSI